MDKKTENKPTKVIFHISGRLLLSSFGEFGKVKENPTSVMVNKLKEEHAELLKGKNFEIRTCDVLTVATIDCKEHIDNCLKKINSEREKIPENLHFMLHFGVYWGCGKFFLEEKAYNCADFRIPDMRNLVLKNEKIHEEEDLDCCLDTRLDINKIKTNLEKRYLCDVSNDPGRYICNYIYYSSLKSCSKEDIASLFVHVPSFEEIPFETQYSFLLELLDEIAQNLTEKK